MTDITRILNQIEEGDLHASEQLLPLVYDELRRLARVRMSRESKDHTLQPTALVHEAYIRLADGEFPQQWASRRHFFAAAGEAMRRILVESARRRKQHKRGGDRQREPLDSVALLAHAEPEKLLAVNDAIDGLQKVDQQAADLVKLRYFVGLSLEDAATSIGIARSTAYKHWAYAKAYLLCEIDHQQSNE